MILPKISKYPRELLIGSHMWRVRFVRRPRSWGYGRTCSTKREICINRNVTNNKYELFCTFLHEVLHALEFEHGKTINHKTVYFLERAIAQFLVQNF